MFFRGEYMGKWWYKIHLYFTVGYGKTTSKASAVKRIINLNLQCKNTSFWAPQSWSRWVQESVYYSQLTDADYPNPHRLLHFSELRLVPRTQLTQCFSILGVGGRVAKCSQGEQVPIPHLCGGSDDLEKHGYHHCAVILGRNPILLFVTLKNTGFFSAWKVGKEGMCTFCPLSSRDCTCLVQRHASCR